MNIVSCLIRLLTFQSTEPSSSLDELALNFSFLFCYVYTYTCICPHGRVVIPSAYNFDWDVGCGIDFRIPVSW